MPSKDQVVAEIPASSAVIPVTVVPARGVADSRVDPFMKNSPTPIISTKGRIFRAVMKVWNLPPPSTLRRCTIMNTSTKSVATIFSTMPCMGRK